MERSENELEITRRQFFQIARHPDGSLRIRYKGTAINIPVTITSFM